MDYVCNVTGKHANIRHACTPLTKKDDEEYLLSDMSLCTGRGAHYLPFVCLMLKKRYNTIFSRPPPPLSPSLHCGFRKPSLIFCPIKWNVKIHNQNIIYFFPPSPPPPFFFLLLQKRPTFVHIPACELEHSRSNGTLWCSQSLKLK